MDGMSKDWKPGDVAIRKSAVDGHTLTTVATTCFLHEGQGLHWHHVGGGWDLLHTEGGPTYRPLVVIDPEDREQVERLAERIGHLWRSENYVADVVQAALREFANPTPPKPEEPTGLGAVVEDAEGGQYVLVTGDDEYPWAKVPADEWQVECFAWHEFEAVRVLSEGVQA